MSESKMTREQALAWVQHYTDMIERAEQRIQREEDVIAVMVNVRAKYSRRIIEIDEEAVKS